jgi:hypothetical protein
MTSTARDRSCCTEEVHAGVQTRFRFARGSQTSSGWQMNANRAMSSPDVGRFQTGLVGAHRPVPTESKASGGDPGAAPADQCPAVDRAWPTTTLVCYSSSGSRMTAGSSGWSSSSSSSTSSSSSLGSRGIVLTMMVTSLQSTNQVEEFSGMCEVMSAHVGCRDSSIVQTSLSLSPCNGSPAAGNPLLTGEIKSARETKKRHDQRHQQPFKGT